MTAERLDVIEQVYRPKAIFPRGWPASGKTSLYQRMRQDNPNLARVSRDDTRQTLFSGEGVLSFKQEQLITRAIRAQAKALFEDEYDVFFDETHMRRKRLQDAVNFAVLNGADYQVIDLKTPIDECVRRDAARGAAGGRMVGEERIRDIARRFPVKCWEPVEPSPDLFFYPDPYIPDESLPQAWITDLDGTVARMTGRDPYDFSRVHEDEPIAHTVTVLRKLAVDTPIVALSGRGDDCRDVTEKWLRDNLIPFNELHMRAADDGRPDFKVKADLFDSHLRNRYHVLGVFDDRLSVIRMWERLGVPFFRLGAPDRDDF
jgi:predicted kinase